MDARLFALFYKICQRGEMTNGSGARSFTDASDCSLRISAAACDAVSVDIVTT